MSQKSVKPQPQKKARWLRNVKTGRLHAWCPELAKRTDMEPYNGDPKATPPVRTLTDVPSAAVAATPAAITPIAEEPELVVDKDCPCEQQIRLLTENEELQRRVAELEADLAEATGDVAAGEPGEPEAAAPCESEPGTGGTLTPEEIEALNQRKAEIRAAIEKIPEVKWGLNRIANRRQPKKADVSLITGYEVWPDEITLVLSEMGK